MRGLSTTLVFFSPFFLLIILTKQKILQKDSNRPSPHIYHGVFPFMHFFYFFIVFYFLKFHFWKKHWDMGYTFRNEWCYSKFTTRFVKRSQFWTLGNWSKQLERTEGELSEVFGRWEGGGGEHIMRFGSWDHTLNHEEDVNSYRRTEGGATVLHPPPFGTFC